MTNLVCFQNKLWPRFLCLYFKNLVALLPLSPLLVRQRTEMWAGCEKRFFLPGIHRGGLLSVTLWGLGHPADPQLRRRKRKRRRRNQPGGRWASPPDRRSPRRTLWQRNGLQISPSAPPSPWRARRWLWEPRLDSGCSSADQSGCTSYLRRVESTQQWCILSKTCACACVCNVGVTCSYPG